MFQHLNDPPPKLHRFRHDAPKELEAVILNMLAKEPEKRYQSVREVIDALRPFAKATEHSAKAATKVRSRWVKRYMDGCPTIRRSDDLVPTFIGMCYHRFDT